MYKVREDIYVNIDWQDDNIVITYAPFDISSKYLTRLDRVRMTFYTVQDKNGVNVNGGPVFIEIPER